MGWRGDHNRELMLEEEERERSAALPPRIRFLIWIEWAAYVGAAFVIVAVLIVWKWTS